ncbi:MAG: glycoside hydrolase family 15 protein [Acidimicrobiales bacterium]
MLDPLGACLWVGLDAIGPPVAGTQSYLDNTMVLRTVLANADALLEITDSLDPSGTGRIIRRIHVLRGPADVRLEIVPGPSARGVTAWSEGMTFDGATVRCGFPVHLQTAPPPAPARPLHRLVAVGTSRLATGQSVVVTVDPPGHRGGPLSVDVGRRLEERGAQAWRRIAGRVEVGGRYGEVATRSALVLCALSGIAGAPVSSPASSLGRILGGERNTDGRLVSPVTTATWAGVAAASGLAEESDAAVDWLVTALEHEPPLPSALAPDGGYASGERHLGWSGWRGCQPVVFGSDAGDRPSAEPTAAAVAATARLAAGPAGSRVLSGWARVVSHADWLSDHWSDPDASIWDSRGPGRDWYAPHLASRWALASAAAEARRRHPLDLDATSWHAAVRDIESWLQRDGVGASGVLRAGTDTRRGGPDGAAGSDAALIRVATWGPWGADDPVTAATLARVEQRLGQDQWLFPYPDDLDDGLSGSEPASVVATLWLARALAACGRWDEAHGRMEAAISLGGSLHLLPQSVNPGPGAPLGNRPDAGAHAAFLDAALAMADAPI